MRGTGKLHEFIEASLAPMLIATCAFWILAMVVPELNQTRYVQVSIVPQVMGYMSLVGLLVTSLIGIGTIGRVYSLGIAKSAGVLITAIITVAVSFVVIFWSGILFFVSIFLVFTKNT
jgi:hypothetical protein